jgi:hypothetical protein
LLKNMTDHPFISLVVESLNLMHPRFAAAHGRAYTPAEAEEPPAGRKPRERSFLMEFYHEFRRLWDRAVPVQRGCGHIVVQGEPDNPARQPDLLFQQLGEQGQPDLRLAALSLVFGSNPRTLAAELKLLARYRESPGYSLAVCVVIGHIPEPISTPDGVALIRFDTDKWQVVA